MSKEADVVVIGSGLAGLCAAYEAGKLGLTVVVIEKMMAVGGNSKMSGGIVSCHETEEQIANKYKDSKETFLNDILTVGQHLNDVDMVKVLVNNINDAVEWTKKEFSLKFRSKIVHFGGHSVARSLQMEKGRGYDLTDRIYNALTFMNNVEILLEHQVVDILTVDSKNNNHTKRAIGISMINLMNSTETDPSSTTPSHASQTQTIYTKHGVVLTTGGFSADIPFRCQVCPELGDHIETTNHSGATSDGLKLGMSLGARVRDLEKIQLIPLTSPDETGFGLAPGFTGGCVEPYGVLIDPQTNKRFINELTSRGEQSNAILKLGHPVIGITDSYGASFQLYGLENAIKQNIVKQFNTLEELALAYNMIPNEVIATVNRFNQNFSTSPSSTNNTTNHTNTAKSSTNTSISTGTTNECNKIGIFIDPEYGKPLSPTCRPIVEPPFYAIRVWPKVHYTMGGLVIDIHTRVIDDRTGCPFEGLYAAGEVTG